MVISLHVSIRLDLPLLDLPCLQRQLCEAGFWYRNPCLLIASVHVLNPPCRFNQPQTSVSPAEGNLLFPWFYSNIVRDAGIHIIIWNQTFVFSDFAPLREVTWLLVEECMPPKVATKLLVFWKLSGRTDVSSRTGVCPYGQNSDLLFVRKICKWDARHKVFE